MLHLLGDHEKGDLGAPGLQLKPWPWTHRSVVASSSLVPAGPGELDASVGRVLGNAV